MADDNSTLDALEQYMRLLATRPVEGLNVHRQPEGLRPAWIQEQTLDPVAFGALSDPVSQVAFLGAPAVLRGAKGLLELAGSPGPRLGGLLGERGNLGPVPRGVGGKPLPESAVRNEAGELTRLYHGTGRAYPDFEMAQTGRGAGGDLYGPGIYLTESPQVAESYAGIGVPVGGLEHQTAQLQRQIAQAKQVLNQLGPQSVSMREVYQADLARAEAALAALPKPNIRPVYADLKRPFDMDQPFTLGDVQALAPPGADPSVLARYSDQNWTGEKVYKYLEGRLSDKAAVNAWLQQQGYDGITHLGGAVTGGQPHRVYIAFSPEQVYPSFNVDALLQQLIQ